MGRYMPRFGGSNRYFLKGNKKIQLFDSKNKRFFSVRHGRNFLCPHFLNYRVTHHTTKLNIWEMEEFIE